MFYKDPTYHCQVPIVDLFSSLKNSFSLNFFKTTSKSQKYGECMRNWNINIYFSVSSIIYYLWRNGQKHNPVDVYSKQNALWIWLHRSLLDNKIKAKDINVPHFLVYILFSMKIKTIDCYAHIYITNCIMLFHILLQFRS